MVRASIRQVRAFVSGALRELPIETVAVLAAAASTIVAVQRVPEIPDRALVRIACAAPIVTALGFALTLLARAGRISRRAHLGLGTFVAGAVLAAVWFGMSADIDGERIVWPYGASLLAAVLTPFATAALTAPRDERFEAFAGFLRRFFEQTTTWALLGAAALAALAVIFASISELFDLEVDTLGVQVGLVATAGLTLAWLYRLLPGDGYAQVPAIWRRLVTAVGAPFVAVMLAILAIYEVWALGRSELPRNVLSPLVVTAGAVGSLCSLIIVAILREAAGDAALAPADRHRWARARSVQIARAFPLALLALLPMAFWALAIRIDEYGLTPPRVARLYALAALAVVALAGAIRYLRRRPPLAWELPAAVAALALAAAFGPLSIVSLSLRSQTARLEEMLTRAGASHDSARAAHPPIPAETFDAIVDQIRLVERLGGDEAVERVLPGLSCDAGVDACLERRGVRRLERADERPVWLSASVATPFQLATSEIERVRLDADRSHHRGDVALSIVGTTIEARQGHRVVATASLAPLVAEVETTGALAARALAFEGAPRLGHLLVESLTMSRLASGVRVELEAIWIRPR